jgi:hypothetical protein
MSRMHRSAVAIAALLLALPASAGDLVSPPGPGEQETAQAGGGVGRFSFVGALRCPAGQAMVGLRTATGPLLNFLELACAPVDCEGGQCRWRPEAMAWAASAGQRTGEEASLLCSPLAVITGFRAGVVPVAGGTAVASLGVQCAPIAGIAASGGFAVGPAADPRVTRRFLPGGRGPDGAVMGACRDRGAAAFSVAVGPYPRGAGGRGEHVRALSMFCPGLTM